MTPLASVTRRNAALLRLPPRVALFYSRARRLAARTGDEWSLGSATKPESLAHLLRLARGRRSVAEIGTGTAWTTIAFALADRRRSVISLDPIVRPERHRYMELVTSETARRIELLEAPGEVGPAPLGEGVEMLFIDGSHERRRTVETFTAWRPAIRPGGIVAFHDFGNAAYPGVTEAIRELSLEGEVLRDVFVWQA